MQALHLGYHYIRDSAAPGPNCAPSRLRKQIEALKGDGYQFLTCGEVAGRLDAKEPLPDKHVTLSFDDGLRDQFTTAFPILQECGVPATFFVITCAFERKLPPVIGFQILIAELGAERLEREILPKVFAGTPYLDLLDPKRYDTSGRKMGEAPEMRRIKWMFNHWPSQSFKVEKLDEMFDGWLGSGSQERFACEYFMSADQLQAMADSGMEIASHTVTHPALDVTGLDEIEQELSRSRRMLYQLDIRASSFAWTFGGKFRPRARMIAGNTYMGSWNFLSELKTMPEHPYADLTDIPRLHEQVFLPGVG
ncbi:hypothetical protein C4552_02650 [Candidatus Parcubacteria bacterium]|nr:MAG: hypothetical protein C4552_02650 [Candidatus Parcubacteria bacterium]